MSSTIIQEFIQALYEEIEAIKAGKGGSTVKVFNGRFLREFSGLFIYVFNLENFLAVLDESPAEIDIHGERYFAQVLMTQGLEVEIGIEHHCGQFIPEAKLQTNLWCLLELLRKKYVESQSGSIKTNFQLSEAIFSGRQLETNPPPDVVECKKCGAKNRVKVYEQSRIPICGKCNSPMSAYAKIQYSNSINPPNEAQKRAIAASFASRLCIIWGPPGTGKTKTIAQAVEAHLNAGRRILLVSHANNAVDEALEDIAEHLKATPFYQDGKLVRLGKPQEEHYKKLEREYELVLPEKITAKLCETLIQEKQRLEAEKERIEQALFKLNAAFQAIQKVKELSIELNDVRASVSEAKQRSANTREKVSGLEEIRTRNTEKLIEAQSAGTIKRFFKRLDPQKIQREIDQVNIALASKRRIVAELSSRLNELKNLNEVKEREVFKAQTEADSILKGLNLSPAQLESQRKDLDRRKDAILARVAEINRQVDEIQKTILSEAKLVATTLTKTFVAKQFPDNPFDVLVLDEASMAPLPHLYWAISRSSRFVTIVGDFLQLPPICISDEAMAQKWLGRSIFEVLGINSVNEACSDSRIKLLDTQYRMLPEISAIPNRFFYQNNLKDAEKVRNRSRLSDGVSESPLVLIDTSPMNPWCSRLSTGGRFNLYNALLCATLTKRIIERTSNGRIGIMTPYNAQARLINKIAKDWNMLERVRISTVHRFQGGEESIIIFDSVEGAGTRVALMLDDTKLDSDARLLLNVAVTRTENRFYFVGHTNHLLSDLHRDSALARLIHYLFENAECSTSENFVDNYFTADFEKWADALLSITPPTRKPTSGDPYTGNNFWPQFIEDLKTTKERLFIHSPFLTVNRADRFIDYFQSLINKGIEIKVHTWPSSRQQGNMVEQSERVISSLRSIGVKVIEGYHASKKHFKTAIIDNRILWDGSLNILSHKDTEEHMWRYEGVSAVEQIIRDLELNEDTGVGNQTDEICPRSGGMLVVRSKDGRKFLGCSDYSNPKIKCTYTRPLDRNWKQRGYKK